MCSHCFLPRETLVETHDVAPMCRECWEEIGKAAGWTLLPALSIETRPFETPGVVTFHMKPPDLSQVARECAPGSESDPIAWAIDTLRAAAAEGGA